MAEAAPIRLLSVEDHPVFREGLRTIVSSQPDMLMVAQAGTAEQAIAEFRRHRPDITLMDLRLPGTNGIGHAHRHSGGVSQRSHHHAEHVGERR